MPTRIIYYLWPAALAALALAAVSAGCGPQAAVVGVVRVATQGVESPAAPPSTAIPAVVATSSPAALSASPTAQSPSTSAPAASPTAQPSPALVLGLSPASSAEPPTAEPTVAFAAELGPTPDALAATRQLRVPILMYHYVEPWLPGAGELRHGLTVRPEDFAVQMAYLHDHGYVTVSLYDLVDALALGQPLPARPVVLTFDDGYRSLVDYAVPTMAQYGFTGTIFVITQLMDEGFPQYLTWPQAEHLYAQGWQIEPHSKTHDQLEGRDRAFQLYQMLGSLQTVEAHIGRMPRFFAYPSGRFDALTLELAREMHLWGAVSSHFGRVHSVASLYDLRRVRVSGTGGLQDFVSGLEGDQAP